MSIQIHRRAHKEMTKSKEVKRGRGRPRKDTSIDIEDLIDERIKKSKIRTLKFIVGIGLMVWAFISLLMTPYDVSGIVMYHVYISYFLTFYLGGHVFVKSLIN